MNTMSTGQRLTIINHKTDNDKYSKRGWEEIEQALNECAKDLMVPKKDEFLIRAVYEVDRQHFDFGRNPRDIPIDENDPLKRE